MIYILSIISILFQLSLSQSQLPCNGIGFEAGGIPVFYPSGLCIPVGENQTNFTKLECSEDGETMFIALYQNDTCQGTPTLNGSAIDIMPELNSTNFTIECCAEQECQFAITRVYHINDCNESISNNTDYAESWPLFVGQCLPNILDGTSMKLDSCIDGERTVWMEYPNSTECEGDFKLLDGGRFTDGFCYQNDEDLINNGLNETLNITLNATNITSSQFELISIQCVIPEMQNVSCLLNGSNSSTTPNPTDTTPGSTMQTLFNTTNLLDNGCDTKQIINVFIALMFSLSMLCC